MQRAKSQHKPYHRVHISLFATRCLIACTLSLHKVRCIDESKRLQQSIDEADSRPSGNSNEVVCGTLFLILPFVVIVIILYAGNVLNEISNEINQITKCSINNVPYKIHDVKNNKRPSQQQQTTNRKKSLKKKKKSPARR